MMKNLYNLVYETAEQNNREEEYYRKGFEYFASSIVFSEMKFGKPGIAFRRLPNGSYIDVRIVDDWYPGLVVSELEKSIKSGTFVAIINNKIQFLNEAYGLHRLDGPAILPLVADDNDTQVANSYFAYGRGFFNETFDLVYYVGVTSKSKQLRRELFATIDGRLTFNIIPEINRLLTNAKYAEMSVKEVCDILLPTFESTNPPFTKTITQTGKISGDVFELKFIVTNANNRNAYLQKFKDSISKQYNIAPNQSRTVKIN